MAEAQLNYILFWNPLSLDAPYTFISNSWLGSSLEISALCENNRTVKVTLVWLQVLLQCWPTRVAFLGYTNRCWLKGIYTGWNLVWIHYPSLYDLHIILLNIHLNPHHGKHSIFHPCPAWSQILHCMHQLHLWDPAPLISDLHKMQNTYRMPWKHTDLITFDKGHL